MGILWSGPNMLFDTGRLFCSLFYEKLVKLDRIVRFFMALKDFDWRLLKILFKIQSPLLV